MVAMSEGEWREFLIAGTRTGKLATVRADGRAHVAPVWFLLDGDDILFNTGADSVKGGNLRRDARATLCVDDDKPPYAFVIITGTIEISEHRAGPGERGSGCGARRARFGPTTHARMRDRPVRLGPAVSRG